MGGDLFSHVVTVLRMRKSQFRKPDKVPRTYDGRTFELDGMVDLDITFDGITMKTPIYVRRSPPEQLLLGEGVCRQLRIISYPADISDRRGNKWHPPLCQSNWKTRLGPAAKKEDNLMTGGERQPYEQDHSGPGKEEGPGMKQSLKDREDQSEAKPAKKSRHR